MARMFTHTMILFAALVGFAPGAHAALSDDAPNSSAEAPPRETLDGSLEFTFTPGAWIPRLQGNVSLGTGMTVFELGPDFHLDDMEPTVLPELAIRKREIWEMHFSGFRFSTSSRGAMDRTGRFGDLDLATGDVFRADFDITSIAAEVRIGFYRAYANSMDDNLTSGGRTKVDVRFAPTVGLRYVEVGQSFEQLGIGRESTGGTWVVPYAGLRFELTYRPDGDLPLIRMLRLEAGGAMGPAVGADGGFAWQVRAGLTCNFTNNLGVMFGYRLLELDVENGEYEFDGGLQGLFIAASLTF